MFRRTCVGSGADSGGPCIWLNASWICTRRYRLKCRVLVSPNLPSNAVNPLKYQWHLPTTDTIMRGESNRYNWIAAQNALNYHNSINRIGMMLYQRCTSTIHRLIEDKHTFSNKTYIVVQFYLFREKRVSWCRSDPVYNCYLWLSRVTGCTN